MKAVVYFVPGFEEVEALAVVDVLRRGGVEVTMAGVEGMSVTSAHQITIQMDAMFSEIDHETVDMMILPGGPGTARYNDCKELIHLLKKFKVEGKWLAAICAAPSILGQAGLLQGEKAICYPGYEEELIGAEVVREKVVVSNHIVTAVGAGAALDFGIKILEILKGREVSNTIRERMIVK